MPNQSCPRCHRPLPYAARRCAGCGWVSAEGEAPTKGLTATSRRRLWLATLAALLVLGLGLGYVYIESLASHYAVFAARYLPEGASALAPADTDEGAFYYCIRQVAKEMDGEFSVETFPSAGQSDTVVLGEGHYRIRSFVDEARETGERVRHTFTCTVRFEKGRWALERLALDEAGATPAVADALQSD